MRYYYDVELIVTVFDKLDYVSLVLGILNQKIMIHSLVMVFKVKVDYFLEHIRFGRKLVVYF